MINYKEYKVQRVGVIEINRPDQLNALNKTVIELIEAQLDKLKNHKKIRSIIIKGAGDRAFVAGADIKEFQDFKEEDAHKLSVCGKQKLFDNISNYNKPIIACINGYALGGGLELALSAHIRVAVETAKMGLPECSLGLIPGYGGTQKLARIIGLGRAMEMILTAKMISAIDAQKMGLVNHVVDKDNLMAKCFEIAELFHKTSPESLESAIKSINHCFYEEGNIIETEEFSRLFGTLNFKEGVSAFTQKRKPEFDK